MMNKSIITGLILGFLFTGCDNNKEKQPTGKDAATIDSVVVNDSMKSLNEPHRSLVLIKKDVLRGNDTAYRELRIAYLDYPSEEFLYWAFYMANRYNYGPAKIDVFNAFLDSYVSGDIERFGTIDKKTQTLMLQYLKEAANENVPGAKDLLKELKK